MSKRALFALAFSVALTAAPGAARADDQTDLAKARAAYEAKNFDDADRRLWSMLNPDSGTLKDPALRTQARMYWGATMLARKNPQEAADQFERLLIYDDPSFEPDPLSFPGEVVEAFIDTRKRIIDKVNAAKTEQARLQAERRVREEAEKRRAAERIRVLEDMATEEKIRDNRKRWRALLPFGVGQFQNGQTALGIVLLASEAAMLATAVAAFPFYVYNRGRAANFYGTDPDADPLKSYRERATTASLVNGVANIAFGVTAVVGIVHAELTFVPYVDEVKHRPLPKMGGGPSGVTPNVSVVPGGGVVGVDGRF